MSELKTLLAELEAQRADYPNDTVLRLIQRLAQVVESHIDAHPKAAHP